MATIKARLKSIPDKQTKSQLLTSISEETGVSKKDINLVLDSLATHARRHLMNKGSGEFVVPNLGVKLRRVTKPPTKARKGRNPITGAEITIKAKPARKAIKAVALKALKDVLA
jgi:nucleoid DNA-binding protein